MVRPVVDNSQYRMQAVDTQPYGNTVSVEMPQRQSFRGRTRHLDRDPSVWRYGRA